MWHKSVIVGTLSASLIWAGCARPLVTTNMNTDGAAVAIRFLNGPQPWLPGGSNTYTQTDLVVDGRYDGFADGGWANTDGNTLLQAHVALWGGPYEGRDVTYGTTDLSPGAYTVAFFDQPNSLVLQGWVKVRGHTDRLLGMLYEWKNDLENQKQQLAYDFDLAQHNPEGNREADFVDFTRQLRALEQFERRLDAVIAQERLAEAKQVNRTRDLLHDVDLLIMPSDEPVFRSTTRPVFTASDLNVLRDGEAATKSVFVADYDDAQWKLRRVEELYGELARYKAVMKEQADRLLQRKGLMVFTDHLHNYDDAFVTNERLLQTTYGTIDSLERQMSDLRERRLALAFVLELVAPNSAFPMLDQEERTYRRQREVVDTEARRLSRLIEDTSEASVRRVALEKRRQFVAQEMDAIDRHLDRVAASRSVLMTMSGSTEVIHRQGGDRLLTAAFIGERLPFSIRAAVERESLMTVRLQADKDAFVPDAGGLATKVRPQHQWRSATRYQDNTGRADTDTTSVRLVHHPADEQSRPSRDVGDTEADRRVRYHAQEPMRPARDFGDTKADRLVRHCAEEPVRPARDIADTEANQLVHYPADEPMQPARDVAHSEPEKKSDRSCRRSWKWLFPPCYLAEKWSKKKADEPK